jgi:Domain of unknown function (DUF6379)
VTWADGVVRTEGLTVRDNRLTLEVHLPWYRSLPLSCLESVEIDLDGRRATTSQTDVHAGEFDGPLAAAAESKAWWDVRDPLEVRLDIGGHAGETYTVDVTVACRIPYMKSASGSGAVLRVHASTQLVARLNGD